MNLLRMADSMVIVKMLVCMYVCNRAPLICRANAFRIFICDTFYPSKQGVQGAARGMCCLQLCDGKAF